jgi:phage/plasmid primase-like uncharacterized protein
MTAPETYFTSTLPEAFDRAGLPYPGPADPGKILRFSTDERDRTDRAGWLSMLPDGTAAAFGCWRSGDSFTWQLRDTNDNPPSQKEREEARQRCEKARIQAERERAEAYTSAASQARQLWASGKTPPADFDYLTRKGINPHVARLANDGRLMLPVHGPDGEIQSLQYIAADGSKRFHTGGKMHGGWLLLGTVRADEPLLLAEGFATAATLHEATGKPVFCAFNAGNLLPVAEMLKARYPQAVRLLCGDDDRQTEGNPGRTKATEAAESTGARVVFPVFSGADGTDFNDLMSQAGFGAVRQAIDGALKEPEKPRFTLLTPADLAALPTMRELVRGVLPEAGLGALFGPSGSGKSFLILDLLGSVTTGADWFGHAVTNPCKAVYVGLEGEAGIAKRVQAFMAKRGPLDGLRVILSALDIRKADDRTALTAAIKAQGFDGGVLVLDTLNRAAPGMDENSSVDMGEVIASMKALQADLGGLVIAVHHSGKDALKGLRGHSSLLAALDCVVEVTRQEDRREWKLSKSKDGEDGKAHPFTLEVVELGEDGDGWPVTSCTIRPEEEAAAVVGRAKVPSGGNQRILWDGVGELLRASTHFGEGEAPPSRPCIQLEEAISQLRGRLAVTTDRQTERARQAITRLVSRGLLNLRDGWLWCA